MICFKTMYVVNYWAFVMIGQGDKILLTSRDNPMNWEMVNYSVPSGRVYSC